MLSNKREMNHSGIVFFVFCDFYLSLLANLVSLFIYLLDLFFPHVGKCSIFKKAAKRLTILTRPAYETIGR